MFFGWGGISVNINWIEIERFFTKGNAEWEKGTFYKGVFRFTHAHNCQISVDEILTGVNFNLKRYWTVSINDSVDRFKTEKAVFYAEKFYNLLYDAVKIRCRSDVGFGLNISGGLDSSAILYIVKDLRLKGHIKQIHLKCVSSYHDEKNYNESNYVRMIDDNTINLNLFLPDYRKVLQYVNDNVYYFDGPYESTNFSASCVFKEHRISGSKVVIDGQGADEQMAGYSNYISDYIMTFGLLHLCANWKYIKSSFPSKDILRGIIFRCIYKIFGKTFGKKLLFLIFKREVPSHLNEKLYSDTVNGPLQNLLYYSDRLSMQSSVESRSPFMDYRLVEFLANVPAIYKIHKGWTKYIARLAFVDRLPDEVVWRKNKLGWPDPEERYRDMFVDEMTESIYNSGYKCSKRSKKDLKEFLKQTNSKIAFRIYNISVFLKQAGHGRID
jgi:asparagine synthase (glutamine-hydrolysing)